jgi:hypothetical protein
VPMVARLGATWGVQRTVLGKTVWITFPVQWPAPWGTEPAASP